MPPKAAKKAKKEKKRYWCLCNTPHNHPLGWQRLPCCPGSTPGSPLHIHGFVIGPPVINIHTISVYCIMMPAFGCGSDEGGEVMLGEFIQEAVR